MMIIENTGFVIILCVRCSYVGSKSHTPDSYPFNIMQCLEFAKTNLAESVNTRTL